MVYKRLAFSVGVVVAGGKANDFLEVRALFPHLVMPVGLGEEKAEN